MLSTGGVDWEDLVALLHRAGVSTLTMAPAGVLHTSPLPEHQYEIFLHQSVGGEKEV